MNILLCTSRMGIGGAETHVLTLATELSRLGHSVSVASSGGAYTEQLEKNGIYHITLPLDSRAPSAIIKSCKGLCRAVRETGADIVHAHGRIPAFVCSLARRYGAFTPFVTTAHGLYDSREPLRSLSAWGDVAIAVSREVENYLKTVYGLPEDRLKFIPNGVNVPENNTYNPEESGQTVICASARMDRDTEDAFFMLLSVFESLLKAGAQKNLCLKLAGEGASYLKIKAESDRINSVYPDSVICCGAVTDIQKFLYDTTVFVGQSRSALEAMSLGIPTVLFSRDGCAGVMNADNAEMLFKANYIPAKSENAKNTLFESLNSLLCSQNRLSAISDFVFDFVKAHNDISDVARSVSRLYYSILDKKKNGILLCGYFGAGNTGDEIALRTVADCISKIAPEAKIGVITRNPEKIPDGLYGIDRLDLKSLHKAFDRSRVLVLCGGSLIQNFTSTRSLVYYTEICKKARASGCRVMIWGGGIGPLSGKSGSALSSELLSYVSAAGLRDVNSFEAAKKLGCTCAYLSADAVAGNPEYAMNANEEILQYFTVCPRKLKRRADSKKLYDSLYSAIPVISRKYGLKPVFVPLAPADVKVCCALAKRCGATVSISSEIEIRKVLAGASFCIAVRLHSAVLSFLSSVPYAAISYDPKVSAFADETGYPWIALKDLCPEALEAAVMLLPKRDKNETDSKVTEAEELRYAFKERSLRDAQAFKSIYKYEIEEKQNDQ